MADPAQQATAFRVLRRLYELRAFERSHLPFLRTFEERDLLCEIGRRQAEGRPLHLKELPLLGIGSVATMQRRLRRLRRQGAVRQRPRAQDRRTVELVLDPKVLAALAACETLFARNTPTGDRDVR